MTRKQAKTEVFNGSFDIEAAEAVFPMGWVPLNGDPNTRLDWSTEKAVYGGHTVVVVNPTYTDAITGIVMDQRYSIDVGYGNECEIAAWLCTERPGVPLILLVVFMKDKYEFHSMREFKFTSTSEMFRYAADFQVPKDCCLLKVGVGVNDTPQSIPSKLWISWVTLRKYLPD